MKTLMMSVMAVAAIAVAVPAAAQHHGPPRGGPAFHGPGGYPGGRQAQRLERQIDRAWQARVMSTGKAREYRHALVRIANLEEQYRFDRDGYTRWERQDIDQRYDRVQANLNRYNRQLGGRRW
ncbi:MAG: hypothetical protein V7678_00435 [Brevundimonas sp.]